MQMLVNLLSYVNLGPLKQLQQNEENNEFFPIFEFKDEACGVEFISILEDIKCCPFCYQENKIQKIQEINSNVNENKTRSICVKPSVGSFYNYKFDCLLHCGISDSKGKEKLRKNYHLYN